MKRHWPLPNGRWLSTPTVSCSFSGNPLNTKGAHDREKHGTPNRTDSQNDTNAYSTKRGMSDTTTNEYQSAGNDIGTNESAEYAG